MGAIAIADLVKTTLGPAGLDKILQSVSPDNQSIQVTNDGATILKSVHVDNAAAKVLVDIAQVQDDQIGDGTTTVAVLAGELLREAEQLVLQQRVHPQIVCDGWRLAQVAALQALQACAMDAPTRDDLLQIARTTLSSKLLTHEKEHFAHLAVDAVSRLQGSNNLDHVQVLKIAGGSLRDSYLEEGFLLEKTVGTGQPQTVKQARILLANTSMDTDKIKIYGSRVKVDSLNRVADIEAAEKAKMKHKVEKILQHHDQNGDTINCFVNRQLIYNYPESLFAERGVMAIEHADFDGVERLACVLGGHVVSTFDAPDQVKIGKCDVVEQILIGEDKVLRFGGCQTGAACSIVLRGASRHVLDEAERSLHDALAVLTSVVRSPQTVFGGGCTEIHMATAVDRAAETTPGKRALAMRAWARAVRQIPTILADNAGFDAAELVSQLAAAQQQSSSQQQQSSAGLDLKRGRVGDMAALGVRESYQSKRQALLSATEAAEMILRVDDIVQAAPRRRDETGY